ncbi:hypothetical protein ER308_06050 [Egibacter rhizosphaerae]|uniref:Uncharacterized protein n=1 Tax=Egibacter rhizosphaerae TaxID=1670831 RepID=A0A411YD75_9ACTN|nr:hypothetical protein [Egibacter rhizosphaerae]QBI19145.1 hypothetical protein ER308_06050 [Egibacter rhizosphaerae]
MSAPSPRRRAARVREGAREDGDGPTEAQQGSGRPPFRHLQPVVGVAAAYALAALLWAIVGDPLPGGRWLAVHLFTLGTITNLIVVMTDHFSRTITRVPGDERRGWRVLTLNVGVLLVVLGLPNGWTIAFALGATVATVAVMWLYVALRRMRRRALGPRFGYVVRAYERACGAFLHGAILGALLGIGVLPGDWYGGVRLAHLAANVLGWAGLVLLATVVFFGPTLMRTRIAPHAERLAVPALRHGATALTVSVVGLVLLGAPGIVGGIGRGVAVLGLAGYAAATVAVCGPVLQVARRAVRSPQAAMIAAACTWFPIAVVLGTAAVAVGHAPVIDAIGLLLLAGVLGQAIVATVTYLLPMVTGPGPGARSAQRATLDTWARSRVAAFNAGVAALTAAVALRGTALGAGWLAPAGWALLGGALAVTLLVAVTAIVRGRLAATTAPQRAT